jgi:hypothetical protein
MRTHHGDCVTESWISERLSAGLPAWETLIPVDDREMFRRFAARFESLAPSKFRLVSDSLIRSAPGTVRFKIQQIRRTTLILLCDRDGTWRAGRTSVQQTLNSTHALIGVCSDVETVSSLSELLKRVADVRSLKVYMGHTQRHVPLVVYADLAGNAARLTSVRIVAVEPLCGSHRAGNFTLEGGDVPIGIDFDVTGLRVTSIAGRPTKTFLNEWEIAHSG